MENSLEREREALVALLRHQKRLDITTAQLRWLLDEGNRPTEILDSIKQGTLFDTDAYPELERAHNELAEWDRQGIRVLSVLDTEYPQQLLSAFDHPLVLFAIGKIQPDDRSIAIVGSRNADTWALAFARNLATAASEDRFSIISGLARGIDAEAHTAALAARARTIAVLGNGVKSAYPSEHRAMQDRIASIGLVVSQFWPESKPTKSTFPIRNATMSAYSAMTVIVTAGENSGTRSQARAAVKHGRPLIITEHVANSTSWGSELAESGCDVRVVRTVDQALHAANRIMDKQARILEWASDPIQV